MARNKIKSNDCLQVFQLYPMLTDSYNQAQRQTLAAEWVVLKSSVTLNVALS